MTNPSYQAGYNGLGTPPGGNSTQWQLGDAARQQDQFYADLAKRNREAQTQATASLFTSPSQTTAYTWRSGASAAPGTASTPAKDILIHVGLCLWGYAVFFLVLFAIFTGSPFLWLSLAAVVALPVILIVKGSAQKPKAASPDPAPEPDPIDYRCPGSRWIPPRGRRDR